MLRTKPSTRLDLVAIDVVRGTILMLWDGVGRYLPMMFPASNSPKHFIKKRVLSKRVDVPDPCGIKGSLVSRVMQEEETMWMEM